MPILLSILTNKYVVGSAVILACVLYVNMLRNDLSSMTIKATEQYAYITVLEKRVKDIKLESDSAMNAVKKANENKITIVKEYSTKKCSVVQVANATKGKEKVDEKDILGSKLPSDVIDSLSLPNASED